MWAISTLTSGKEIKSLDEVLSNANLTNENIDNLEIRIAMIVNDARTVASSVTFLTRRGWPTEVYENVGKALMTIVKTPPDFVFLSLNHPSPKIAQLPNLLKQTFNVPSVLFLERADTASVMRLQASPETYKLNGASSGPSLHRYIRKLLMTMYGVGVQEDESKINESIKSESQESSIHISGQDRRKQDALIFEGQKARSEVQTLAGQTRMSLSSLLKEQMPQHSRTQSSESLQQLLSFANESAGSPAQSMPNTTPQDVASPQKTVQPVTISPTLRELHNSLNRITQNLLAIAIKESPGVKNFDDQVCVIAIDSPDVHGYVVLDFKLDPIQRHFLCQNLITALRQEWAENKQKIVMSDPFFLSIGAELPAVLSFATVYDTINLPTQQVTVAFFMTPQRIPMPQRMANKMSLIKVKDFSTEVPVNFKAYLRLVKNNKYLLYLRAGRTLMQKQKEQLLNSQVFEFHISEKEELQFRVFTAFGYFYQLQKTSAAI